MRIMFEFLKNRLKRKEEQEKARQQRFQDVMNRLQVQDITIEKQKQELIKKVKLAQADGLSIQVEKGKKLLANCIATEKRIKGMIMDLEYSIQYRELSELTRSFLTCMKDIGKDICKDVALTDTKAEKEYEKAMYALEEQTKVLDSILETADVSMSERLSDQTYSAEVEEEINKLLEDKSDIQTTLKRALEQI